MGLIKSAFLICALLPLTSLGANSVSTHSYTTEDLTSITISKYHEVNNKKEDIGQIVIAAALVNAIKSASRFDQYSKNSPTDKHPIAIGQGITAKIESIGVITIDYLYGQYSINEENLDTSNCSVFTKQASYIKSLNLITPMSLNCYRTANSLQVRRRVLLVAPSISSPIYQVLRLIFL